MTEHRGADRDLNRELLTLDLAEKMAALKPESAWQAGDRNAKTLYKDSANLRPVLTVLKAGATLAQHSMPGPVTIHVLDGRGRLKVGERALEMQAGSLVALERNRERSLEAIGDCAVLISIARPSDDHRV
jgi:quercetin dioxygenase-like cupin family protein